MNREEAKALMRQELEREVHADTRAEKIFPIGDRMMSVNDLIEEIENETELGKFLLDDFLMFKNGTIKELDATGRAHAITLMEGDLKIAPPGWADEVVFEENGQSWTPNQIMKEVRDGTDFGNRYVSMYLANHEKLKLLLGPKYDQVIGDLFSLPPINMKVKNDKAN